MRTASKRFVGIAAACVFALGMAYTPALAEDAKTEQKQQPAPAATPAPAAAAAQPQYTLKDLNEQLVMATLWVQTSVEYKALCQQVYNWVKVLVDKDLAEVKTDKKRIIIVDGDETTIQANTYEAFVIDKDQEYPTGWYEWVASATGEPIPGAVEGLNYAASKGVETYYVTNRKIDKEFQGTLDNLKKFGFPNVDAEHVVYRQVGQPDDKLQRQLDLEKKHHLVVYVGDDFNDFPLGTHKKSLDERSKAFAESKDKWGSRYLMLPNPMYGSWEKTLKNNQTPMPADEQNKMRRQYLRKWK